MAEAGTLLAFGVGNDSVYRVRLVRTPVGGDPLTEIERGRRILSCDARLDVRHGRVFLDNGDALPHEDMRGDLAAMEERAFDLPIGLYRATVHVMDIGAAIEAETVTEDDIEYVVAFTPVDRAGFGAIPAALHMSDLRARPRDGRPLGHHDAGAALADALPLLPVPGASVRPGEDRTFEVPEQWHGSIYREVPGERWPRAVIRHVLVFPELGPGATGTICAIRGASAARGGPWTISLLRLDLVRLEGPDPPRGLMQGLMGGVLRSLRVSPGRSDPWGRKRMRLALAAQDPEGRPGRAAPLPASVAARLRDQILAVIRRDAEGAVLHARPPSHGETLAAIGATRSGEPLLDWALRDMDLPGTERLAIWRLPVRERLEAVGPLLRAAAGG